MMDFATNGLSLANSVVSLLASLGIIATLPGARRILIARANKGRWHKRRRLLRRYLWARTLAQRPLAGLADMAAIGCLMILTSFFALLNAISFLVRRSEGPPLTGVDALSMLLLLILLAVSFVRAASLAAEIKNAPKVARRLKAGLRKPKYRPLSKAGDLCPCGRKPA